jgi:hypothetical protein
MDLTGMGAEAPGVTNRSISSPIEAVPTTSATKVPSGIVASPPGAEYKIIDYAICKNIVDNKPVDSTDTLSTEDARVYQLIDIAPHYRAHTAENRWYSPDGALYKDDQYTSEDKRYDDGWTHWSWMAIKGHKGRGICQDSGKWKPISMVSMCSLNNSR